MKIEIVRPKLKKPYLKINNKSAKNFIDFSISHTDDLFAVGIAPRSLGQIGIDIERVRNFPEDFMEGFMTNAELRKYKNRATLIWSAKEAYLKAIGVGLLQHPKTLEITLDKKTFNVRDFKKNVCAKGSWAEIDKNYVLTLICLKN